MMTLHPCGPNCIARDPILNTAESHAACPQEHCRDCRLEPPDASSTLGLCATCHLLRVR